MEAFNRFGNMNPTPEYAKRPYLMDRPPFRIAGNLYFVGNLWCSVHLIDTGAGLILLDTPIAGNLPGLINNIWSLGFNPADIKYIIVSHAHADHYGAVRALVHMTGAKTFLSAVDAEYMRQHIKQMEIMNQKIGYYNECFEPDVELEDGDLIELGNTRIRCVLTPGHTVGVMSHFWTLEDGGRTLRIGIYGGAGFVTVSKKALEEDGLPLSVQQTFLDSIDKVWDEPVDLMLGNHPFHNDTYHKYERMAGGDANAFIDPTEWHRFLSELRDKCRAFLAMTPEQVEKMYARTQMEDYYRNLGPVNPGRARTPTAVPGNKEADNESA